MEKSCIISINDVWHTFGEKMVLQDVNLTVNEGDFVAITGPNGGGKTTILRLILHLLKPTKGSVLYFEGDKQVERLKFGYLPQKNSIDSQFSHHRGRSDSVGADDQPISPYHGRG